MRRFAALAVVTIGMIGFVGCGGGGGSSDTSTADAGGGPPAPAGAPPSAAPPSSRAAAASGMADPAAMSAMTGAGMRPPGGDDSSMDASYDPGDTGDTGDAAAAGFDDSYVPPADDLATGGSDVGDAAYDPYSAEGLPGAGYGQQQRVVPQDYAGKAELAFREGRDRDAMNYVYAHGLSAENGPAENLEKIKWSPALRRPTMAVRWGVGIEYTAPKSYQGDPMAAGKKQNLPQRRGRGGGDSNPTYDATSEGNFDGSEFGGGGSGAGNPTLKKYTGDIGDKFLEKLNESIGRGDFGAVLASALEGGGGNRQQGGAGAYPDDGYDPAMEGGAGYPAAPGPGRFGPGGQKQQGDKTDQPQQLSPGVTLLGLGEQKELLLKAKDQDLDALVVFTVDVTPNPRTRLIQNETRLELFDVASEKRLERSSEINNIKVQIARDDENKDDGIGEVLDDLFAVAEKEYKLGPLPEGLKPEHVRQRIQLLTASKYKNPLPVLTEIQFYQQSKLLDENEMAAAYIEVIGKENAETMVRGTLDEKKAVLKAWLPEEKEEPAPQPNVAGRGPAGGRPGGSAPYGPGGSSAAAGTPGAPAGSPGPGSSSRSGPYQPPGTPGSPTSGSPGPSSGYGPGPSSDSSRAPTVGAPTGASAPPSSAPSSSSAPTAGPPNASSAPPTSAPGSSSGAPTPGPPSGSGA